MKISIDSLYPIKVARHHDGAADKVVFDLSAWRERYPNLTKYHVEVTAPSGEVYLPAIVEQLGDDLEWTIMPSDTATEGDGAYQIVGAGDNSERKTSASARFVVRSIMPGTASETPPDPAKPWVDKVMDAAERAEEAAKRAENAGGGSGGISEEKDPTVPAWAKEPNKPTYTAEEVGAQPKGDYALRSEIPTVPVQSVNGKTGAIQLNATDVGAASKEELSRLSEEIVDQSKALNTTNEMLFRSGASEILVEVPMEDIVVLPETLTQIGTSNPLTYMAAVDTWKIPVVEGQKHYITNVYRQSAALYAYIDADGKTVERVPESVPSGKITVTDYEVIAPANAVFLCVNNTERWQNFKTVIKTTTLSEEKVFRADELVSQYVYNPLYGKKLVICGDSITEARNPDGGFFISYGEVVAKRNGMTCVKDGLGGSTMTNVEGHAPFCVDRYLQHTDFDYLTIWFGWNDGAYATLGTIDDTDDTTFYGAYKKVLTHYMTTYPTKKLGLVVPYGFRTTFQQAVRDISELFGVPCLDLADGKQCSMIWGDDNDAQIARRAALTYDTTHPNQAGHDFIATMYEHFLRSL